MLKSRFRNILNGLEGKEKSLIILIFYYLLYARLKKNNYILAITKTSRPTTNTEFLTMWTLNPYWKYLKIVSEQPFAINFSVP